MKNFIVIHEIEGDEHFVSILTQTHWIDVVCEPDNLAMHQLIVTPEGPAETVTFLSMN
jgi:hypothetical protein